MNINPRHSFDLLSWFHHEQSFHTQTVDQERPEPIRHRHFVAIPLIALALLLLALTHQSAHLLRPTLIDDLPPVVAAQENDLPIMLRPGTPAVLMKGSTLISADGAQDLREGSILVRADAPALLRAGAYTLSFLHGAAHITYGNDTLTVAAVNTSVLVQTADASLLVPAGSQWRSGLPLVAFSVSDWSSWAAGQAMAPLPEEFLQTIVDRLHTFPAPQVPSEDAALSLVDSQPFWKLPGAQKRAERAAAKDLPTTLASLLHEGRSTDAERLLAAPAVQPLLIDPAVVESVLALPSPDPSVVGELLKKNANEHMALLWSLRPGPGSWSAHLSPELTALRLRQGFVSGDGELALNEAARNRANADLTSLLSSVPQEARASVLGDLLSQLKSAAESADAKHLPERLRALTTLADLFVQGRDEMLNDQARAALESMHTLDRPAILPETAFLASSSSDSSASSTTSSVEALSSDTADIVIAAAHHMLAETNGMISVNTSVTAVAPHTAKVTGVFYATPKGDKSLEFLYDTEKKELRDMRFDGKQQPFPMTEEAFAAWVKRDR